MHKAPLALLVPLLLAGCSGNGGAADPSSAPSDPGEHEHEALPEGVVLVETPAPFNQTFSLQFTAVGDAAILKTGTDCVRVSSEEDYAIGPGTVVATWTSTGPADEELVLHYEVARGDGGLSLSSGQAQTSPLRDGFGDLGTLTPADSVYFGLNLGGESVAANDLAVEFTLTFETGTTAPLQAEPVSCAALLPPN